MDFQINEFSKAFISVRKNINWIGKQYPEILKYDKLTKQIKDKGLWLSGGFRGQFDIDRSTFQQSNSNILPPEIVRDFKDDLFEIPNEYRPEPGAETLLKQGEIIEHPPLKSIALIAREIGNYCVLAVATGQLDDKGRDRIVGYRCFWLDVSQLQAIAEEQPEDSREQPDGILTLLNWWFDNERLCFNMNPDSLRKEPWSGNLIKTRQKKVLPPEHKEDFPPFIIGISQDQIAVKSNNHNNIESKSSLLEEISNLHSLALAASETFEDCDLAWAWNVFRVTKTEKFSAIACSNHEALVYCNQLKSDLPSKTKKDYKTKEEIAHILKQQELDIQQQPDPPYFKEIKRHLDKISRNYLTSINHQKPNISPNIFRDLLSFYFDNYPVKKNHSICLEFLKHKSEKYRSLTEIKYRKDAYYIYLLFILADTRDINNLLNIENFRQNLKEFNKKEWYVTDLIKALLHNFKTLKKDIGFLELYYKYQKEYDNLSALAFDLVESKVQTKTSSKKELLCLVQVGAKVNNQLVKFLFSSNPHDIEEIPTLSKSKKLPSYLVQVGAKVNNQLVKFLFSSNPHDIEELSTLSRSKKLPLYLVQVCAKVNNQLVKFLFSSNPHDIEEIPTLSKSKKLPSSLFQVCARVNNQLVKFLFSSNPSDTDDHRR